jgi:tight adherence protein B
MDAGFAVFILVLFIAVVLLIEGGYLLWDDTRGPAVRKLERRLRSLSAGQHGDEVYSLLKQQGLSDLPWLDRILISLPRVSSLDRWLVQSGMAVTVGNLIGITLFSAFIVGLVAFALNFTFWISVLLALVAAALPVLVISVRRSKRLARFDEQLPEALDLMSRALRAGHAFPSALQMVGTETVDPIASEFAMTFDEVNYGVALSDAMMNLATRVPSMDLRYFIVSVILQRETGGNLSELLDKLSMIIRERFKLMGRVRVLSAEGKLSAYILIGLPFATAFMIYLTNKSFLEVLWTDPSGLKALGIAAFMMCVGALWMWRIVKIRV